MHAITYRSNIYISVSFSTQIIMPLNTESILFAQSAMKRAHIYDGPIDGVLNDAMGAAVVTLAEIKNSWLLARKVVAYLQKIAGLKGNDIDGHWGPQTEAAYTTMVYRKLYSVSEPTWRPEDRLVLDTWPSYANNEDAVNAFYGQPGTNLKKLVPPYAHFLSWDPGKRVTGISCNTKVHDSLGRVLTKVLGIYGASVIERLRLDQFGGCFNKRLMRGGTRWSTHSWGIALDYDPNNNRLKWGADKASFSRPEYQPWWECWEEEGWVSLGRSKNFDWMHVQAARL